MAEQALPLGAGRRVWTAQAYRRPAGAGSLARTAPHRRLPRQDDSGARTQASLEDSALTHFDPRCQLACAAFNAALAHAVTGGDGLQPEDLIAAARVRPARGERGARALRRRLRPGGDARHRPSPRGPEAAQQDDPCSTARNCTCTATACPCASPSGWPSGSCSTPPPRGRAAGRRQPRRRTRTPTRAITGALLGAFHGEDALPSEWRKGVLEAMSTVQGPLGRLPPEAPARARRGVRGAGPTVRRGPQELAKPAVGRPPKRTPTAAG